MEKWKSKSKKKNGKVKNKNEITIWPPWASVHTCTFGKLRKVFFQLHLSYKLKFGLSRHILLLSCLNQRKHFNIANTCFAREPYSLSINSTVSLETFQSGWFHESAWIHYQQKHNPFKKTASLCSTRQRLRCQHKKKRSCLNRWQYQV